MSHRSVSLQTVIHPDEEKLKAEKISVLTFDCFSQKWNEMDISLTSQINCLWVL